MKTQSLKNLAVVGLVATLIASSASLPSYARGGDGGGSSGGGSSGGGNSSSSSSVDDNLPRNSGIDNNMNGVNLRGDGTVDDNLPRHSGIDNNINGIDLRGDGTIDDNLPRHSGLDDFVNGVKLRGDGTIDDNQNVDIRRERNRNRNRGQGLECNTGAVDKITEIQMEIEAGIRKKLELMGTGVSMGSNMLRIEDVLSPEELLAIEAKIAEINKIKNEQCMMLGVEDRSGPGGGTSSIGNEDRSGPNRGSSNTMRDIENSFAKIDIQKLMELGAIKGFDDGTFRPNNSITRAEFLKIAIQALGESTDNSIKTSEFADVSEDWMKPIITKAKAMGVISGQNMRGRLLFRPNDTISRFEAVKIMLNLKKIQPENNSRPSGGFADINDNTIQSIATKAKDLGIISGQTVRGRQVFRPNDSLTRAEAAKVITRSLEVDDNLPKNSGIDNMNK